jgi:hypothetical protein
MVDNTVQLGEWVSHQRQFFKNYKEGKKGTGASITEERIAQLNAIGFEWRHVAVHNKGEQEQLQMHEMTTV